LRIANFVLELRPACPDIPHSAIRIPQSGFAGVHMIGGTRDITRNGHPEVAIHNLTVTFPGKKSRSAVRVLDGISFDVHSGEFVCIVGPSGCGKSTILNILGGFLSQTSGTALVGGEPVTGPDPRRIFIFQENAVFPWMTVEDNVGFGLRHQSQSLRDSIVKHYIELVGLTGFEHAYSRELSGGMRQRVELARALAANPDILYMDEPFGSLDYLTRLKMRADLVHIWNREKKTILFVTHDIDEAVQLADRVVVLSSRPAQVREVMSIDIERPREVGSAVHSEYRARILSSMGLSEDGKKAPRERPSSM
jgi:NitT/TauT family transport system ATP-binding protein